MHDNGECLLISLYVDDRIYISSFPDLIEEFKFDMMNMFGMSYLEVINYFLGLEVR